MRKDLVDALDGGLERAGHRPGAGGARHRAHRVPAARPRAVPRRSSTRMGEAARRAHRAPRRRDRRHLDRSPASRRSTRTCSTSCSFVGNREQYEDPRNSCLNEVLDRRTGIPITLSVVYMEVARRAGLPHRRRQLPRPLPGALPARASRARRRPHHRSVPRRRAALRARLPPAAAAARRRRGGVQQVAARAGDAAADHRRGCC